MPAAATMRPRERLAAFGAVALVQLGLGLILLNGLKVEVGGPAEAVQRLVEIALPRTPPPVPPPVQPEPKAKIQHSAASAPKALPKPIGGSPGPQPSHALPAPTPVIAVRPSAPAPGGGSGTGPALGAGAGGGSGGQGFGGGGEGGGTDLIQIAGAIGQSDYPRDLRERGVGGRVEFTFTVEPNGRVGRCSVTRSSGVPELDALTCRLVQQRFVYRPSTDRSGRPIEDEVDGVYDWVAH
ncbi:MAG: TonB family protein [Sphingomonas sp.]|nr:TonB family protein [Sphingomonas sp.]